MQDRIRRLELKMQQISPRIGIVDQVKIDGKLLHVIPSRVNLAEKYLTTTYLLNDGRLLVEVFYGDVDFRYYIEEVPVDIEIIRFLD